ncbi:MAG TPA: hypothetical protein VFW02_02345, partial [Candidatus Limnocylindrales bacterium]|nr:hypothetical protein [Candidatus Limnocylindrales bacterium]
MSEQELRQGPRLSRRAVLKAAALGTMATGVSAFLAACGVKTSSPGAASSAASAGSSVAPSGGASVAPSAAEA